MDAELKVRTEFAVAYKDHSTAGIQARATVECAAQLAAIRDILGGLLDLAIEQDERQRNTK